MSENRFFRRAACFVAAWSVCSVFTYGHAYKQFHTESMAECAEQRKANPSAECYDMDRDDAVIASLFWPQHWSEVFWR